MNLVLSPVRWRWLAFGPRGRHRRIPGTKRVQYLEENVAASDIDLDAETLARLNSIFDPSRVKGDRYGMRWNPVDAKDY